MRNHRHDTGFEDRVAEMLHRRARDIPDRPDETTRPLPDARVRPDVLDRRNGGTEPRRWLLVAAVALLATGGGAAIWALAARSASDGGAAARVESGVLDDGRDPATDRGDDAEGEDGAEGGVGDVSDAGDAAGADDPALRASLDDVVASLPPGLDLRTGSTIWLDGPPTDDPHRVARDYLADRLPGMSVEVAPVDDDELLHLFRWEASEPSRPGPVGTAGWLIVRLGPEGAAVVAATTDGVEVASVTRDEEGVSASVTSWLDGRLLADVTDLHAQHLDGTAAPIGPGPGGRGPGTAGSGEGPGELLVETDVPAWPVSLRVQIVDETGNGITEMVLDPVGFTRSCGAGPPVGIEVGDRLGPLASGSLAGSSPTWPNQLVWHHAGTEASKQTAVEIRWPADPTLVGRFPLASLGPGFTATTATGVSADPVLRSRLVTAETHAIIAVADDAASNPCALVQFTVRGDPDTAEWWAGALGAEWSFDVPLTLATPDLDPLAVVDGDDPGAQEDTGLVVAALEDIDPNDVPRVPATGSCDGLPDDPPRTGPVPDTVYSTAREALADLVATADVGDGPPLPGTGYEEYWLSTGDDSRIYVNRSGGLVLTVVEVERSDGGGWRVARWEAAVC